MTVKPIAGQPASSEVRKDLARSGKPVLLAFSRGKDALATWIALKDAGVKRIIPYHLYGTPGIEFEERDLARWQDFFGQEILHIPHPSLYLRLRAFTCQTEDRASAILAAKIPDLDYAEIVDIVREAHDLPADTWVCDGVRAADSPQRRVAFADHGVWKPKSHKVSPIWDWTKAEVMDCLAGAGAELGRDYDLFGRSMDGIDARFTLPLKEHEPQAWEQTLRWWPLAEFDQHRQPLIKDAAVHAAGANWRDRKKVEAQRYKIATDSEAYLCATFADQAARDAFLEDAGADDKFVSGPDLAERFGIDSRSLPPTRKGMGGVKTRPQGMLEKAWLRSRPRVSDPLASVDYSGDLTKDSTREMAALYAAFPEPQEDWACIYFASRVHKQEFLQRLRAPMGEKFVSGEKFRDALMKG